MTAVLWLLPTVCVLGLLDIAWIGVGWVADHRITTAARHRKKEC